MVHHDAPEHQRGSERPRLSSLLFNPIVGIFVILSTAALLFAGLAALIHWSGFLENFH